MNRSDFGTDLDTDLDPKYFTLSTSIDRAYVGVGPIFLPDPTQN